MLEKQWGTSSYSPIQIFVHKHFDAPGNGTDVTFFLTKKMDENTCDVYRGTQATTC